MHVTLVGSGPSAKHYRTWSDYEPNVDVVAVVNGAIEHEPNPDFYGVFEISGGHRYADHMRRVGDGKGTVFTRPAVSQDLNRGRERCSCITVPNEWGGPLQHLNKDRYYKGGYETWMSSGVLLMWVLTHLYKPHRITVLGLDGYVPGADYSTDQELTKAQTYDELWRRRMNEHMSYVIGMLTRHYKETEFIWPIKPNHFDPKWRVKLLDLDLPAAT